MLDRRGGGGAPLGFGASTSSPHRILPRLTAGRRPSRSAAAPALVRHLYGAPWIRPVRETDLAFCGSLAAEVPVFTLSRPASLARADACATMLRDG